MNSKFNIQNLEFPFPLSPCPKASPSLEYAGFFSGFFVDAMKLHDLKPNAGAKHTKIRRGRGDASGYGSFSGRGSKGQKARTGGSIRPGFEGGQTPLLKRMPKRRGFRNPMREEYIAINLDTLEKKFPAGALISPDTLKAERLIRSNAPKVKILARGELSKKFSFKNVALSQTAKAKIEKLGGSIEV